MRLWVYSNAGSCNRRGSLRAPLGALSCRGRPRWSRRAAVGGSVALPRSVRGSLSPLWLVAEGRAAKLGEAVNTGVAGQGVVIAEVVLELLLPIALMYSGACNGGMTKVLSIQGLQAGAVDNEKGGGCVGIGGKNNRQGRS
ncbi:hypothetical protein L7F22_041467 [Adiantum nelumboides]|nr:hypothetical protein [Adiantum nelumboides]